MTGTPEPQPSPSAPDLLAQAEQLAQALNPDFELETGENALAHARAVAQLLREAKADVATQTLPFLLAAWSALKTPEITLAKQFGGELAGLAANARKLISLQQTTREGQVEVAVEARRAHAELMRKMLIAFSQDLRVVLLRLASRLQTLRYYAASKRPVPHALARETLEVMAPVANRLGVWQFKWELEDLGLRFSEPVAYKAIARLLDEKRAEREGTITRSVASLQAALAAEHISADVAGRPKHIYSIYKKMQGKALAFDAVMDVRALRVLVEDVKSCYAALGAVHTLWTPLEREFDDYIARPKSNGYQSLHTVVLNEQQQPIEVQIRTHAMHQHAEFGIAAHWAYKEQGGKAEAASSYDQKIAIVRQLITMQSELSGLGASDTSLQTSLQTAGELFDDRIYVLTPQAAIVELQAGSTAIDFAYALHTQLGHRCRGARIDGRVVPLNTVLANGQTVEITSVKEGGPSRDWLNAELGFLKSHRAKAKVRAWFNGLALAQTTALGRLAVEKLLQRLGKTALNLGDLAAKLGFKSAELLFESVGKDEFSLRSIEALLEDAPAPLNTDEVTLKKSKSDTSGTSSGILAVGVDSLLTQLARCCKPVPPDAIGGFVTRTKGISVHRADCANFKSMGERSPGRLIPVTWGADARGGKPGGKPGDTLYSVDVYLEASDRQGLLRDISEVFSKEKINVVAVKSNTVKHTAFMTFTAEIARVEALPHALALLREVSGVNKAVRK